MTSWELRLRRWLARDELKGAQLEPLRGDVSLRRYARLRLSEGGSIVAAVYPDELRDTFFRFTATTALLADERVPVPRILEGDAEAGIMLLEDAGTHTLYEAELDWPACLPHLRTAISYLERIRGLDVPAVSALNPPLDADLLWKELELTWSFVLEPQGLVGRSPFKQDLLRALQQLCDELGAVTPVPCHRDFMARNLMLHPDGRLIVIDHQDLRLGPPGYDLASLLHDTLFAPPAVEDPLLDELAWTEQELLQYRRAIVQRMLKIVGTFHRFAAAGSRRYLPLVPLALRRSLENLAALPETAELAPELRGLWHSALAVERTA